MSKFQLSCCSSDVIPLACIQNLQWVQVTNQKLKRLYNSLRGNLSSKRKQIQSIVQTTEQLSQLQNTKERQRQLQEHIQRTTHIINLTINENKKLKVEVDGSRSNRVIYSNVYKGLQKQIRKHEHQYKCSLMEGLLAAETYSKLQDRVGKAKKKIEKEIAECEGKTKCEAQRSRVIKSSLKETKESLREREEESQRVSGLSMERDMVLRQQRKQRSVEQAVETYEYTLKLEYYEHLLSKIRGNCRHVQDIVDRWATIDGENEDIYAEYSMREEQMRRLEEEEGRLLAEIKEVKVRYEQQEHFVDSAVSEEERALIQVEREINAQTSILLMQENIIDQKIDFNCCELATDNLRMHLERMTTKREKVQLQKILDQVQKEKKMDDHIVRQVENRKVIRS